jgi:hypothetical protein
VIPVVVLAGNGVFSRYVADDFCTANVVARYGLLGAQAQWYMSWTGRFGSVLVIDLLAWLGPWTVPLTPALLLLAWIACAAAAAHTLRGTARGRGAWQLSALAGAVLALSTLAGAPSLWQSVYWQTGAVTYLLPLVLMTAAVVVGGRACRIGQTLRTRRLWTLTGAALVFLSVGCSEIAMGLVVGILGATTTCLVATYHGPRRGRILTMLGIWLATALVASVIVIVSPGNSMRGTLVATQDVAHLAIFSSLYPAFVAAEFLLRVPAYSVLAYGAAFLIGKSDSQYAGVRSKTAALGAVAVGYTAVAAAGLPAMLALGSAPPERAEIIPVFALVSTLVYCGYLHGVARRAAPARPNPRPRRALVLVLGCTAIVLGPVLTTVHAASAAAEFRAYADAIDGVDAAARAAVARGQTSIVVPGVTEPAAVDLTEILSNPSAWPNTCIAEYYGLQAIAAYP